MREIDLAAFLEGPSIYNCDFDRAAVFEIRDHHAASQRKLVGRGGETFLVIKRAGGSRGPSESWNKPISDPDHLRRRLDTRRGGRFKSPEPWTRCRARSDESE